MWNCISAVSGTNQQPSALLSTTTNEPEPCSSQTSDHPTDLPTDNLPTDDDIGSAAEANSSSRPNVGDKPITKSGAESHKPSADPTVASSKTAVPSTSTKSSDLGTTAPRQPALDQYPSIMYGKKHRRFQNSWHTGRPWLEYSVQFDACFRYCCRTFTKDNEPDADPCFTTTEFRNWKTALEDGRGFAKHASSKIHVDAALKWAERNVRIDRNLTIQSQLSSSQIEKTGITVKALSKSCSFLLLMS